MLPRSAWDDKAREAFDAWVEGFQLEVVQAGTEARQVVTALEDTLDRIREIQSMMSSYDWGTVGALFTLFVAGMVPAYTAPARAAQQIIAVLNGVATGVTVGALLT